MFSRSRNRNQHQPKIDAGTLNSRFLLDVVGLVLKPWPQNLIVGAKSPIRGDSIPTGSKNRSLNHVHRFLTIEEFVYLQGFAQDSWDPGHVVQSSTRTT